MLGLFVTILSHLSQLEGIIIAVRAIRHGMGITAEVLEIKILANERVECPCIGCTLRVRKHHP